MVTTFSRSALILGMVLLVNASSIADDWPQWMGPKRDGVWREDGILDKFPEGGPKVLWRVPVKKGYAGPAVADGRVFVMDFEARKREEGEKGLPGTERVLCFDEKTGKPIWNYDYPTNYKISYPEGPRTTATVDEDRVYTIGAMGELICFEAATGKIKWKKNLAETFKAKVPIWGFATHPVVDGKKLIVTAGGEGNAVVALDKLTGEKIWNSQTVKDIAYSPGVIYEKNGTRQFLIWLGDQFTSLNIETGEKNWTVKFPKVPLPGPSVSIMQPVVDGNRVLLSDFYTGALLIEIADDGKSAKELWMSDPKDKKHKDDLNVLMSTPIIRDNHIFGVAGNGEMRCLSVKDQSLIWRDHLPLAEKADAEKPELFGSCFIVQQGDRYFILNDNGVLVIGKLTVKGYEEIDRAKVLEKTGRARGRDVVWSPPAFANGKMIARNDKEMVCFELKK